MLHQQSMDGPNAQSADVIWRGEDPPVSARFGDRYFSGDDGLAECAHVFFAGNALPQRLRDGLRVAELGFGTGLNALALARLWSGTGAAGRIHYTGFEGFPIAPEDMARALGRWPELEGWSAPLVDAWAAGHCRIALPGMDLSVRIGDARRELPAWEGLADAWFLDGFSPACNPELWEDALLVEVARHTAPGGTFATYSAAGRVRRALAAAGFAVERWAGHGAKRHMSRGVLGAG